MRYGLTVETFLKRNDERNVNDIYVCTFNDSQDWYYNSSIDESRGAYIFETLSTAHGSATLTGEKLAGDLFTALDGVVEHLEACDNKSSISEHARKIVPESLLKLDAGEVEKVPLRLRNKVQKMEALIRAACEGAVDNWESWTADAKLCLEGCIRRSIEMRCVAVVTRDRWPFSRS